MKLVRQNQYSGKRISEGKVAIYEKGNWSTICDKNWTMADAEVTCTDIGFPGAVQNTSLQRDIEEYKNILYKDYRCTGSEDYLNICPSKRSNSTSRCLHVAGLRCKDEGIYFII